MAERVYPPVIKACKLMFRALDLTIEMTGLEHVPASGGVVLAANHVSYLDFIFAGLPPYEAQGRLTRFMAKEVIFENKIAGPLMRGMHHIPVDREAGSASFRHALRALKDGEIVGLFPEATTSRSFTVKEIKSGAARMAAAAKVPLMPVSLWGTHKLWAKGRRLTFARGTTIQIAVGEPMTVGKRDDMDLASEALRTTLQEMLSHLQATHPDTANPGPQAWYLPAHLGGTAPTPEQAAVLDAEAAARRRAAWEAKHGRAPSSGGGS
ncbi:MAG: lysophospholipid acyltransferase family protein [Actinomycetales bacterium]